MRPEYIVHIIEDYYSENIETENIVTVEDTFHISLRKRTHHILCHSSLTVRVSLPRSEQSLSMFCRDYHINNLESTVENHETRLQNNETSLRTLTNKINQHKTLLVYLQNSILVCQIAVEADLKAVEYVFSGGTSIPYS